MEYIQYMYCNWQKFLMYCECCECNEYNMHGLIKWCIFLPQVMMHCNLCWSPDIYFRWQITFCNWLVYHGYRLCVQFRKCWGSRMHHVARTSPCVFHFGVQLENTHHAGIAMSLQPCLESLSEVEPGKAGCWVAAVNRIGLTWVDILRTWSDQCNLSGLLGFQLCKIDTQSSNM